MKFDLTPKPKERIGARRIIKVFALFPIKFRTEVRWLEYAYVLQEYGQVNGRFCWFELGFIDREGLFFEDRVASRLAVDLLKLSAFVALLISVTLLCYI